MKVHFHRRISRQKYTVLFNCFAADIAAVTAGKVVGINRKTADRYYKMFRSVVLEAAIEERKAASLGNGVED